MYEWKGIYIHVFSCFPKYHFDRTLGNDIPLQHCWHCDRDKLPSFLFRGWIGPIVGGALMYKVGFQSMTSVSIHDNQLISPLVTNNIVILIFPDLYCPNSVMQV